MVTVVPMGPDVGFTEIIGPVTVSVALAKSPVLPVTVIVYVPATTFPTVKCVPVNAPELDTVHAGVVATVPGVIVHEAAESAGAKPFPVIVTNAPAAAVVGVSVIAGVATVTVNVADATSPLLP